MFRENDHVLDHVDSYLHGVLASDDAAYLEQHCRRCRVCAVALDEARKRSAVLQTVPAREASEELIRATLAKVGAPVRGWPRARRWLLAGAGAALAASVVILAALHLYYLNLAPTPYDLTVLGQTRLLPGSTASLRVRLTDHATGLALAGVPVEVELLGRGRIAVLARFTTDAQGTGQPRFRLPDWEDGSYELRVSARPAGQAEVVTEKVELRRVWKVMLSSDKPVYQPGQEIHLRALTLRRPDLKPVAGQDVTFSITDPKGNVIFKRQGATSRYGIAACDCPL